VARAGAEDPIAAAQSFTVTMEFGDGSLATIVYGTAAARTLPKETVEVHVDGASLVIDDFRRLTLYEGGKKRRRRGLSGKGHDEQFRHVGEIARGRSALADPDPLDTMAVTLAALESVTTGRAVSVKEFLEREAD
jgi:predicted dehydrogenase